MVGLITCKTHGGVTNPTVLPTNGVWFWAIPAYSLISDLSSLDPWMVCPFYEFWETWSIHCSQKVECFDCSMTFLFFHLHELSIILFWTNLYHITWMNMDIRCRCSWDGPLLCWAHKSRLDHWKSWLQVVTALPPHWIYWRFVHSLPVSSWCALICGSRDVPAIFSQVSNVLIELYWKRL